MILLRLLESRSRIVSKLILPNSHAKEGRSEALTSGTVCTAKYALPMRPVDSENFSPYKQKLRGTGKISPQGSYTPVRIAA